VALSAMSVTICIRKYRVNDKNENLLRKRRRTSTSKLICFLALPLTNFGKATLLRFLNRELT
jgi:hypothetical protein